jgi:hypothetical protein
MLLSPLRAVVHRAWTLRGTARTGPAVRTYATSTGWGDEPAARAGGSGWGDDDSGGGGDEWGSRDKRPSSPPRRSQGGWGGESRDRRSGGGGDGEAGGERRRPAARGGGGGGRGRCVCTCRCVVCTCRCEWMRTRPVHPMPGFAASHTARRCISTHNYTPSHSDGHAVRHGSGRCHQVADGRATAVSVSRRIRATSPYRLREGGLVGSSTLQPLQEPILRLLSLGLLFVRLSKP